MQESLRQLAHWRSATRRLADVEQLATVEAWRGLEGYLGVSLRRGLGDAAARLEQKLTALEAASRRGDAATVEAGIQEFRMAYSQVESVIDFYVDALNTRSAPLMGSLLRACDWLAAQALHRALLPLALPRPPVLVYADKGLGAAILKADLRLWDGTWNPAAAIRVAMHNIVRPTALVHEAGHQVAHATGWTRELAQVIREGMPAESGETWAAWASEIAADVYAFCLCGYASVLALQDVLDGGPDLVLTERPGDPHPTPFLRVVINMELCRHVFGAGPWVEQKNRWIAKYSRHPEAANSRAIAASLPEMPRLAELLMETPLRAFRNRSARQLLNPEQVSPESLRALEMAGGDALWKSGHFARQEALRLVALAGYRIGLDASQAPEWLERQEVWMKRMGREWLQ
ncbi:MAG: hypothetical protein FJW30_09820 [Acidobacteria bacterium]|nr:hypothetical protein [Acidobacteriota bacterium]